MRMLLLAGLSLVGFVNAAYLHWQYLQFKKRQRRMFCLIGESCSDVVGSEYGHTFGLKNEVVGMVYYAVLVVAFLVVYFVPSFFFQLRWFIFLITFIAMLFSFYLFYLQTVVIRKLCSWCLVAITLNILIFFFIF